MKKLSNHDLFTASDVAHFCQVDLKTIHNWADKGEIRHFRTPGRHLRFRRLDVLDFLRKYGYPIPAVVQQLGAPGTHGKPTVVFIEPDASKLAAIVDNLGRYFSIRTFTDMSTALISMGEAPPDALVFDAYIAGNPAESAVGIIKSLASSERMVRTRCVIFSDHEGLEKEAREAGAHDFIAKKDGWLKLKKSLMAILGLEQEPEA